MKTQSGAHVQEIPVRTQMYLADIGVRCHNCGVKFLSRQIPVIVDTGYRTSELRLFFGGAREQFEPYAVCTCPSCGLSDWATAFKKTNEPAVLNQPNHTPHLQYRAAAISAERSGRDFFTVGMFYLYAAWCADDDNAQLQAREYRKLAIESFKKSLLDGSCPSLRRREIEYLIGELFRRAGDTEGALQYFRNVIPRLPGKYALMARRLMQLAHQGYTEPIDFKAD